MLSFQSEPQENDDKLPIEYSRREALNIYFKRLVVFLVVVTANMLIFFAAIAVQRISYELSYLLNISVVMSIVMVFVFLISVLCFAYLRSNPVRGELVFSDEGKAYSINLNTGWRTTKITKRNLARYDVPAEWGIDVLTARNVRNQEPMEFDVPRQIHIRIRYGDPIYEKYPYRLFELDIRDGETVGFLEGITIRYQR